jgi:hypothetical protein
MLTVTSDRDVPSPMLESASEQTAFVYTTYVQETPGRVWQGLTDPALMKRYWRHHKAGPKTFHSDWKKGSAYEMAHDEAGLVVSCHGRVPIGSLATGALPGGCGRQAGRQGCSTAVCGASGMVTTSPPLWVIVRVRWPHSRPRCSSAMACYGCPGRWKAWPASLASCGVRASCSWVSSWWSCTVRNAPVLVIMALSAAAWSASGSWAMAIPPWRPSIQSRDSSDPCGASTTRRTTAVRWPGGRSSGPACRWCG